MLWRPGTGADRQLLDPVEVPAPYIRHTSDDDQFIDVIGPRRRGAPPASFLYGRQGRKVRSSFFGEVDLDAPAAVE